MADKYKSLKVKELQEILQKHGLPHSGKKEELIDRLVKHDERNALESLDELAGLEEFEESKLDLDSLDPDLKVLQDESSKAIANDSSNLDEENTASAAIATTTTATPGSTENKEEKDEEPEKIVHKPGSNFAYTPITFGKGKTQETSVKPAPAKAVEVPKIAATTTAATTNEATKNEVERKLERAKRFNLPVDDKTKLQLRAERFGQGKVSTPSTKTSATPAVKGLDPEVLKKRAERFGLPVKQDDDEKKRKRAERFGVVANDDNKKKQRR